MAETLASDLHSAERQGELGNAEPQTTTQGQGNKVHETEGKAPETKVAKRTATKKTTAPVVKPKEVQAAHPGKPASAKPAKTKPTATKPLAPKPAGVNKAMRTKPSIHKNIGKQPLEKMLLDTRRRSRIPGVHTIKNVDSGCFGLAINQPHSKVLITHTIDCECKDVRLRHICQHVDRLVKKGLLRKRFRNDYVIVTKIRKRLPQPVSKELRFPAMGKKQVIRRPQAEIDAEDRPRSVIEGYHSQRLVEQWKDLEAFKQRLIWKDW